MQVLVFNPGGNSLKAAVVDCDPGERSASDATERTSLSIEGIGKDAKLLRAPGKPDAGSEPVEAKTYGSAAERILDWLERKSHLSGVDRVAIRVVHGGPNLTSPLEMTGEVVAQIEALESLAPLHNKPSLEVLNALQARLSGVPIVAVFDSAFHHDIPEEAALYAIPTELSTRHHIRRYGFHGISHRYMLERYAHLHRKPPAECNLITMHLESGCSITAIRNGRSVDNTMGLTPLEGLMMGTRSGDVDPSLIPFLVREEGLDLDQVMDLLNKRSGLLGVSGESLDTRVLTKIYGSNPKAKLALDMFRYRVLKAVGSYLAVLGGAEAILFGGGIGANGTFLRKYIGERLSWCGLNIDAAANERLIDVEGKVSTRSSKIEAWVIVTQEGLEIAHECSRCSVKA
jgi:acetate kinase